MGVPVKPSFAVLLVIFAEEDTPRGSPQEPSGGRLPMRHILFRP